MPIPKEKDRKPPSDVLLAIKRIIDYLWQDEKANFENCDHEQDEHVFRSLIIVRDSLEEPPPDIDVESYH